MAVLQLVDDGLAGLDTDVNRHLKRLQVPSAGTPPLTLRHLLSHTGGLDELPGRQFDGREPQDFRPSCATVSSAIARPAS